MASLRFTRSGALILGVVCLGGPLSGAGAEAGRSPWAAHVAPSVVDFSYKEFDAWDELFDREDGLVPGITFGLLREWRGLSFVGRFSHHGGEVDYDGHTQSGIPITTATEAQFTSVWFQAERPRRTATGRNYAIYAGLGYNRWVRDIQSTRTSNGLFVQGLLETYSWWTAAAGGRMSLHRSGPVEWEVDARLFHAVDAEVDVDSHGLFDRVTLEPKERPGFRIAFPWHYARSDGLSFVVEPWMEYFEFGESDRKTLRVGGAPVGTAVEPRSETRNLGLSAGFVARF